MPETKTPPQPFEVNPESEPFNFSADKMRNDLALTIVNRTFQQFETWRFNNHDRRWNENDALYQGFVPAKNWEGTNVPRANQPRTLAFDQVESAYPVLVQALFDEENWFEVVAEPGTSAVEAQKVQDAMQYVMDYAKNDYGIGVPTEIKLSIRDILKYGSGFGKIEWNPAKNRPYICWVDIRNVYVDPGLSTPNLDESRALIHRVMMTVEEIEAFRTSSQMNVPSESELWYFAQNTPSVSADHTKTTQEAMRNVDLSVPLTNYIPNPADRRIEVLMYYTNSKIIWVLNRQWVMYNAPNPYGFIPFVSAPCVTFSGRFYGQGIPEVIRTEQRLIEGLLNGRMDEVSLALHPPRIQSAQGMSTNAKRAWGPGFVFTGDSKDSVTLLQPQPATQNVFEEISYLESTAEKKLGISGMTQGLPKPGNANRTATGMNLQAQSGANRLQPFVQNIEDYFLVPLLRKVYKMMAYHLGIYDKVPGAKKDGVIEWVEGWNFHRPMEFSMHASSKMIAKSTLMQLFPFVTQYLLSGPLMEAMKSSGSVVNFPELLRMLQDAAGTRGRYELIRPMTPEEQQQAQTPPPEVQAQAQQQQAEHQNRLQLQEMKGQQDLQKTVVSKQGSPEELQMKLAEGQQKMELEKQKAQLEMMMKQMELRFKQMESQMKLQLQHETNRVKVQEATTNMALKQQQGQQDLELSAQRGQMDLQTALMQQSQALSHEEASHRQSMAQSKESGGLKTQLMRDQGEAKLASMKQSSGSTSGGTTKPRKKAEVRPRKKA